MVSVEALVVLVLEWDMEWAADLAWAEASVLATAWVAADTRGWAEALV